jgi:hypothetical protein
MPCLYHNDLLQQFDQMGENNMTYQHIHCMQRKIMPGDFATSELLCTIIMSSVQYAAPEETRLKSGSGFGGR